MGDLLIEECESMEDISLDGLIKNSSVQSGEMGASDRSEFQNKGTSDGELSMSVSPVIEVAGEKKAFVSFFDNKRLAEGEIPNCKITKNQGFLAEEVDDLERYMKANLTMLKKMAASVDVLSAFMKN